MKSLAVGCLSMLVTASASLAQVLLQVDFNGRWYSATEPGFTGIDAVLDSPYAPEYPITIGAYTVTMEASTTLGHWQNDAFNPDNHAELYKDYVRAEGPSVLTLTIGGLTPNTVYTLRTFHWFGNPGIIGSLTLTPVNETVGDQSSYTANYDGSVFPESLDDFSVLMTLTSNSSGEISIESNGGSWGTYTNVLNGFVLSAVPEPSTASLAIGVGALLGLGRRRRRESIR